MVAARLRRVAEAHSCTGACWRRSAACHRPAGRAGVAGQRNPAEARLWLERAVVQGIADAEADDLLQRAGLATQVLDLVRGRGPGRIASQSLLPGLEKVFRPAVMEIPKAADPAKREASRERLMPIQRTFLTSFSGLSADGRRRC